MALEHLTGGITETRSDRPAYSMLKTKKRFHPHYFYENNKEISKTLDENKAF